METILIIIAIIMALEFCVNCYFNITARKINNERYNENKNNKKEVEELEAQLSLLNKTVLNSTNELMGWKNAYIELSKKIKEKENEIEELKKEEQALKVYHTEE